MEPGEKAVSTVAHADPTTCQERLSMLATIPATRIPDCFLSSRARVSRSKRFSVARNTFASTDLADMLGHDIQPISPFRKAHPGSCIVSRTLVTTGPPYSSVTKSGCQHLL